MVRLQAIISCDGEAVTVRIFLSMLNCLRVLARVAACYKKDESASKFTEELLYWIVVESSTAKDETASKFY